MFDSQVLVRSQIARPRVTFEIFCARAAPAKLAHFAAGLRVDDLLVGLGSQELAYPETTGVVTGLPGGQHMVGSDALLSIC